ncbi:MAG: hypothetical protein ABL927_13850, partial [Bdellovibrionales bacterium]
MKNCIFFSLALLFCLSSAFGQSISTQKKSNGGLPLVDSTHVIGHLIKDSVLTLPGKAFSLRILDLEFYKDSHSVVILVDSNKTVKFRDTFIYKGYADFMVQR